MAESFRIALKTFVYAFVEVPMKFVLSLLGAAIFLLSAFLSLVPCVAVEILTGEYDTPLHKFMEMSAAVAEKLADLGSLSAD